MASLTRWTWAGASSRSWWRTGKPGMLQSLGSLRVGHDWATSLSSIGEGNGNPLQCSCLENPRDGGAWWAAIYGVAQSQTWLKRPSSSSSSSSSRTELNQGLNPCPPCWEDGVLITGPPGKPLLWTFLVIFFFKYSPLPIFFFLRNVHYYFSFSVFLTSVLCVLALIVYLFLMPSERVAENGLPPTGCFSSASICCSVHPLSVSFSFQIQYIVWIRSSFMLASSFVFPLSSLLSLRILVIFAYF